MSKQFAIPVLFLIFNRPDTTQQVFNRIKQIQPKYLFVAADGPRLAKAGEFEKCNETRNIIKQIDWDCELKTLFREENLGCGVGVSSAVNWFFSNVEYGIILEDDCLPALSFFSYCEELLTKYKDDEQVMLIGGINFQNGIQRGKGSYYFSCYPHIWGWASWRRAWHYYDFEMKGLESFAKHRIQTVFNSHAERVYWKKLLPKFKAWGIDTWDYQWFYSIWNRNGFSITPNSNLVVNLGFRNSSTHTFLRDSYKEVNEYSEIKLPLVHPEKIIDKAADKNTFNNVLGYNLKRLFRLFRENDTLIIIKFLIRTRVLPRLR